MPDSSAGPSHLWAEIATAVILGLSTLATTWSTYQSTLWDGEQLFLLADAGRTGREAAEMEISGGQRRGVDLMLFLTYLQRKKSGDEQGAGLLFDRFRPQFQAAVRAWEASPLDRRRNTTPFQMSEYQPAEDREADQLRIRELDYQAEAKRANGISDRYVLLTVISSVALFLAGVAASFRRFQIRVTVLAVSILLVIALAVMLAMMPLARVE